MARRKQQKPTPEQIEAQADEFLLNADREMLLAISQNVQALCDGMAELKLPSNDPEYLSRLQRSDEARAYISNKLTQIDVVRDGNRTYLGVGSFQHGEALDLSRRLADLFECKIRSWEQEA